MGRRRVGTTPTPSDDSAAAQETARLVSLLPDDLQRSGVDVEDLDFAGFEDRADCQPLLRELTRAVPVSRPL